MARGARWAVRGALAAAACVGLEERPRDDVWHPGPFGGFAGCAARACVAPENAQWPSNFDEVGVCTHFLTSISEDNVPGSKWEPYMDSETLDAKCARALVNVSWLALLDECIAESMFAALAGTQQKLLSLARRSEAPALLAPATRGGPPGGLERDHDYLEVLRRAMETNMYSPPLDIGTHVAYLASARCSGDRVCQMLRATALGVITGVELGRSASSDAVRPMVSQIEGLVKTVFPWSIANFIGTVVPFWFFMAQLARCWPMPSQEHAVRPQPGITWSMVENQPFRTMVLDDEDRKWWIHRLLFVVGRMLWRRGVLWWASHGTLLGAARHHGFVPHDHDVDIDVFATDARHLDDPSFRQELGRNGIDFSGFRLASWSYTCWPVGLEQDSGSSPNLDIYLVAGGLTGTDLSYFSLQDFHSGFTWPLVSKAQWKFLPFGGWLVVAPGNYAEYLRSMYGPDWNETTRAGCRYIESRSGSCSAGVLLTAADRRQRRPRRDFRGALAG